MKYQTLILLALGIGVLAVLVLLIRPEEVLNAMEMVILFVVLAF